MEAREQRSRWLLAVAGVAGAGGVAAAAASAHGGDARLMGAVALVCLTHAPAFLALSTRKQPLLLILASLAMVAGIVLFCGDLAMRALYGTGLFPMAAPAGGVTLIGAWCWSRRRRSCRIAALIPRPETILRGGAIRLALRANKDRIR